MNGRLRKLGVGVAALSLLLAGTFAFWASSILAADTPKAPSTATSDDAANMEFVTTKIQPLLESRCFECHSAKSKKLQGGLRLDSRETILKGGESGPVVDSKQPTKSVLIDAINYRGDYEMPPKTKMPDGEIALLTKWVEMGAPWPGASGVDPVVAAPPAKPFPLAERKAAHWAWRQVANPPVPPIKQTEWPRDDLDTYVLARLEAAGLKPAAAADRQTLARRVWFDLIGLPPTPQQIEDFVKDPAPTDQALDKVVDTLLASPHFGERWGRHWLDLMRYCESRGHEFDHNTPNAWQYRDYVIRALNADVPYNQFVTEHIAGDLLSTPRLNPSKGFNESVLATGFWYLGDWVHSPVDPRRDETDRTDNMLDTMSRAFLGLTLACARCHDHKFDALSTKDYYALAGYVRSSDYQQVSFDTLEHNRQVARQLWKARAESKTALRHTTVQALKKNLGQSSDYLQAALAVIAGQAPAEAASTRHLAPERLNAWVAQVRQAGDKNQRHPLLLFARLSSTSGSTKPAPDSTVADLLKDQLQQDTKQREATAAQILVDYARLRPGDWVQNGFAFGEAPVRPGDLLATMQGQTPVLGVELQGAARRDSLWKNMSLTAGTQTDAGQLEGLQRSGQTLRTPSFPIRTGRLHVLVRGQGRLFIVISTHEMINGPLHTDWLQNVDTGDATRWVSYSFAKYRGQRGHVEFVSGGERPLEVYLLADGQQSPPPIPKAGVELVARRLGPLRVAEISRLAGEWQQLLGETLDKFDQGTIADAPHPQDAAALADWAVRNADLFGVKAELQTAAAPKIAELRAQEAKLGAQIQRFSRTALAMADGSGEDEQLLIRGNSSTPGGPVPRRFLEALVGPTAPSYQAGSGRLELARQMVDPATDPFISRVIVNRLWYHLLGRGIVSSVDNFGVLGDKPSNPELLDHLATKFVAEGWSVKKMIRLIITSRTYQMSSRPSDQAAETSDPDNVLLHRMNLRRLEGEAIRDAILFVSGRMDPMLEGKPVPVYLTSFMTGRGRPDGGPLDGSGRRSIYTSVRRNFLPPMMLAFDMPVPASPVGRRNVSNVPAQPLILLNDPFVVQQAGLWAKRVLADRDATPEARIRQMYLSALGRPPEPPETAAALQFLQRQTTGYHNKPDDWQHDAQSWTDLCHVLWNVKEFIFID